MRDDFLVIIEWQQHVVRARCGVGEVIGLPTVEIAARAALRLPRSSDAPAKSTEYLVGQALDEAERSGEELQMIWPMTLASGGVDDDQANSGSKKGEGVSDWAAVEALFRYVLSVGLGLPLKPVNYMFLVTLPAALAPSTHEYLTQIFFENLFASNLLIITRPELQMYSCASLSSIVVDVGPEDTDVSVIYDTQLHRPSSLRCQVGERDCDEYLIGLMLQANPELPSQLCAEEGQTPLTTAQVYDTLRPVVHQLKRGDYIRCNPNVILSGAAADGSAKGRAIPAGAMPDDDEEEEGITDVAKAIASGKVNKLLNIGSADDGIEVNNETDEIIVPHPTARGSRPAIAIGPERYRYAEPLFEPGVLKILPEDSWRRQVKQNAASVQEIVAAAVTRYPNPEHKATLWESVIFTGGLAVVKGVAPTLLTALHRYAAESTIFSPTESGEKRRARHAKTPDYFSEYKERPDLTGFLGGCIYAKLGFLESQGGEWITKQTYNQYGPRVATMLVNGN